MNSVLVQCFAVANLIAWPLLLVGCNHSPSTDQTVTRRAVDLKAESQRPELATATVEAAPAPRTLRLPGTLTIDPRSLVHVHTRFPGEVVKLGTVEIDGKTRPLQHGDHVTKGQLLAKIWSKEIGEKKSELVETMTRLEISSALHEKLAGLIKGIVAEREILDARRAAEADQIALTRVERTLRSWRVSETEIERIKAEAHAIAKQSDSRDLRDAGHWAEVEILAPMSGVILEKNFNVGDMVETEDDLFQIGDLSRLQVVVSVYEEDLAAIRHLKDEQRVWRLDCNSTAESNNVSAQFDLVGNLINPEQRTGMLIGWIANPQAALSVGQFVTAEISLPADPQLVVVPRSAVEGSSVLIVNDAQKSVVACPIEIVRTLPDKFIARAPSLHAGQVIVAHANSRLGDFSTVRRIALSKR